MGRTAATREPSHIRCGSAARGAPMTQLRGGASAPRSFPVLPLRTGVLFPGTMSTLPVGRKRSVALVQALHPGDVLGVVTQRDPKVSEPGEGDLHAVGTLTKVVEISRLPGGEYRLTVEGLNRFELRAVTATDPFWQGEGSPLDEVDGDSEEAHLLAASLREHVQELAKQGGGALGQAAVSGAEPGVFADQVAAALGMNTEKELLVLAEREVPARLKLVSRLLAEAKTKAEVKRKIEADVRQELGRGQREAILREQLRAIHKELGDAPADDLATLRQRLDEAGLPEEARAVVDRELHRLEALTPQQPEYNVIRTYLDWFAELPWSKQAEAKSDLSAIAAKLDADHFGLGDVKKRILEHMAVLKLTG